jgi:hypothetical protein
VELLVSIGVAAFILFTVNAVFRSVTDASRQGNASGEALRTTRVIGDQLQRDFEHLVGPAEGGVLVIVNHRIDAPIIEDHVQQGRTWPVRTDQLLFIRDRADLEPLAPANGNSYSNDSDASHVRMWFGHLRRVAPNGTDDAGDYDIGPLGQPDSGSSPPEIGTNQLAGQWLLGRQALFFEPNDPISPINVNGAWADAPVPSDFVPDEVEALYWSVSDVAEFGFLTLDRNSSGDGHGGLAGFVNTGNNDNVVDSINDLFPPRRLFPTTLPRDFRDAVARYLFIGAGQRLRANPAPQDFESWRIAQMHAIFAERVSDFEVTFAGDYFTIGNAGLGRTADPADQNPQPDGELDVWMDGEPIWYGSINPATGDYILPPTTSSPGPASIAALPFVEADNAPSGVTVHPILEDTPADESDGVQLVDSSGNDVDVAHAQNIFIFRHTQSLSGKANWPEMIRVRYRLNDASGRFIGQMRPADEDGADNDNDGTIDEPDEGDDSVFVPGRWFEHVFRIEPRRR